TRLRAVAADHDECVGDCRQPIERAALADLGLEFLAARAAEHRAAAMDDAPDVAVAELAKRALDQPRVAALDAERAPAAVEGGADDRADRRVHSGRITSARQYGDRPRRHTRPECRSRDSRGPAFACAAIMAIYSCPMHPDVHSDRPGS